MKIKFNKKNIIIYCITILIGLLYIYIGRFVIFKDVMFFSEAGDIKRERAKVQNIISVEELNQEMNGEIVNFGKDVTFEAEILSGENKGKIVEVSQNLDITSQGAMKQVEIGDKLFIQGLTIEEDSQWYADEFIRIDGIVILGIVFIICVLIFGRLKGINTVISLIFTCLAVFLVFIPSILAGANIYLWATITCIYITAITMLIVYGANKKSLVATAGCISGTLLSGLLTVIMSNILKLTGLMNEETVYLMNISDKVQINLVALIFGAITVGAIGAVMDVSISIASSLNELCEVAQKPTFKMIIKSGMNIGRDMMGTMTNTLILAYIGSSLSCVLLQCTYSESITHLLNKEIIIVEMLQGLVGSIGILFTIPFTTFICGLTYISKKDKSNNKSNENLKPNENKLQENDTINSDELKNELDKREKETKDSPSFIKKEWKNKLGN